MNLRLLLVLAGGAAALWSISNWRKAIQLAMVLLVLEGAIRKWLFPGAQDLVYFAKDVLLLASYIGFLRDRARARYRAPSIPPLYGALGFGVVLGLFQIFNPNLPSLLIGVLGFKSYFLYVPLLFVLPAAFASDRELWTFLRRYVLLAVPIGVLATLQFFSPADSPLNTYARGEAGNVMSFGSSNFVRVTGTFSYITGYSSYLLATAILILSILTATRWQLRGQIVYYAARAMTVPGMFMTGSRGPVFALALLFPAYGLLTMMVEKRGGALAGRILIVAGLLLFVVAQVAPDALQAFLGRATSASDAGERMFAPLLAPFHVMDDAGAFGFGIGATHQAASTLVQGINPYAWLRGVMIESETGKIMLELGPVGFLAIYFTRLFLAGFAVVQVFKLRTKFHRAVATSSALFLLVQIPGSVVFDPTTGVYYWFFAGLLTLAMRLDRQAVQAARATAAAQAAERAAPESVPAVRRISG